MTTHIDLDTTSDRLLTEVERQQKYLDRLPDNYVFPLFNAAQAIRAIRLSRVFYPEQSATWVFAADSASGHIEAHKEDRIAPIIKRRGESTIRNGVSLSKSGNNLRQSYRTLAQVAGVAELDAHLLMNHSLPGVNAGYITRDKLSRNHLRAQQQRISSLVEGVAAKLPDQDVPRWLRSGKVRPPLKKSSTCKAFSPSAYSL